MADKKMKYKSHAEAEKAYAELESKLGTLGTEGSASRKQTEELQNRIAAYDTWAKQVSPVIDYVNKNRDNFLRYEQAAANPTPQTYQGQQAQAAPAYQQQGVGILTSEEQQAIEANATQRAVEHMNEWVTNTFVPHVETWANGRFTDASNHHQRNQTSFQETLYRGLEAALTPDQLESMNALHRESLRLSDTTQMKPMDMARERISLLAENATLKASAGERETSEADQERQNATIHGMSGLSSMALTEADDDAPMSDRDMLRAVEQDVIDKHGASALRELY